MPWTEPNPITGARRWEPTEAEMQRDAVDLYAWLLPAQLRGAGRGHPRPLRHRRRRHGRAAQPGFRRGPGALAGTSLSAPELVGFAVESGFRLSHVRLYIFI